jgi:hypothetical protein
MTACEHGDDDCPLCRARDELAAELRKMHADRDSRKWESLAASYGLFLAHASLSLAALTADREGIAEVSIEVDDETVVALARCLTSIAQVNEMLFDGTLFD